MKSNVPEMARQLAERIDRLGDDAEQDAIEAYTLTWILEGAHVDDCTPEEAERRLERLAAKYPSSV
jgi:hypothetical protein